MTGDSQINKITIMLTKNDEHPVIFDQIIYYRKQPFVGIRVTRCNHFKLQANPVTMKKSMKKRIFHQFLGHPHPECLLPTAHNCKVALSGILSKCSVCALANMKKGSMPKFTEEICTKPGERMYIYLFMKNKSFGNN
jgi:hypothetical protein